MPAMRITFVKGRRSDCVSVRRPDGGQVETELAHKGPIPHDAVHFFVERGLGFASGFWGMVASGLHPEEIAALAKRSGHPSAKRGDTPAPAFVQAIQAERIVEAFEADQWSGGTDPDGVKDMAAAGCWQSNVPSPNLPNDVIVAIRRGIATFAEGWRALPEGGSQSLDWEVI